MAQFTAVSVFNNAIADQAESLVNTKKRIAILRSNKSRIEKILRPVALIMSGAGLNNNSVFVNADSHDETFTIGLYIYGLESFKAPALVTLIEYFDSMSDEGQTRTRDWPESINRDYHFRLHKGNKVTLGAYVKDDSPTCRKVVIGSEVKEVFKYEIQCD
jgi:hypothetical protein